MEELGKDFKGEDAIVDGVKPDGGEYDQDIIVNIIEFIREQVADGDDQVESVREKQFDELHGCGLCDKGFSV